MIQCGIEYEGTTYYTQYKLPGGQIIVNKNSEGSERNLNFTINTSIDGINADITVRDITIANGTLSYKKQGDNSWKTITNYTETEKNYKVSVSESGNYVFRIKDNTDSESQEKTSTVSIVLTNKPKTSLNLEAYNYGSDSSKWAYLEKNNVNYVWIPRFVYKNSDIKFIKGNSNITTDNTYINDEWTVHNKFTTGNGTKLTGLWVEVSSKNQAGLDMIELLNSSADTLTEIY